MLQKFLTCLIKLLNWFKSSHFVSFTILLYLLKLTIQKWKSIGIKLSFFFRVLYQLPNVNGAWKSRLFTVCLSCGQGTLHLPYSFTITFRSELIFNLFLVEMGCICWWLAIESDELQMVGTTSSCSRGSTANRTFRTWFRSCK